MSAIAYEKANIQSTTKASYTCSKTTLHKLYIIAILLEISVVLYV